MSHSEMLTYLFWGIINSIIIGKINRDQIYQNEKGDVEPCGEKLMPQCHCGEAGSHD